MRIANEKQLNRLIEGGNLGQRAATQVREKLGEGHDKSKAGPSRVTTRGKSAGIESRTEKSRSPAELALRPVLADAFGWWSDGGELVEELEPFSDRKVRVDFALPRWQIYIEVDGWQHHGAFLETHHKDRERAVLFSARNWLPFRVSYQQAVESGAWLVDNIREAMQSRNPWGKGALAVEFRETARSGQWCRLQWGSTPGVGHR